MQLLLRLELSMAGFDFSPFLEPMAEIDGEMTGADAAVVNEVQSTVSSGAENLPKWQALVNTAADAMDVVSDTWTDVSGAVSEMLPDQEEVNETVDTAVKNIKERWEPLAVLAETSSSTPAKLMLQDILLGKNAKDMLPITESSFTEEEIKSLIEIAKRRGTGLVTRKDFDNVTVGSVRGDGPEDILTRRLSVGDSLYNSLGDTTIKKDPTTGEYYVEDTYDWNVYTDYTVGKVNKKSGRREGKVYSTEEFESSLNSSEELYKTLTSDASIFEKAHNIAWLFGSRDYTDNSKDTGRKIRISLGKLN